MFRETFGILVASRKRMLLIAAAFLCIAAIILMTILPVQAARFSYRGMYINSGRAGDTTYYTITLAFPTAAPIGSIVFEFCDNPIPSLPCNVPSGLDVSGGSLTTQSGSTTGFSITQQTTNLIVISRAPSMPGGGNTSYRFDNMVNPDTEPQDFSVRITSHSSIDGSGAIIDYGSVNAAITPEQGIYTQVPPIIQFCVAQVINDLECTDMEGNYVDFGELSHTQTASTSSQVQLYTNAQNGASISMVGKTMTSGIKAIDLLTVPTASFVGVGQFGVNIAANTVPAVGAAPSGPNFSLAYNPTYTTPDLFSFTDGDVLASSSAVTLWEKFTVSYIVNIPEDQPPGVYSTTISYICLAGF